LANSYIPLAIDPWASACPGVCRPAPFSSAVWNQLGMQFQEEMEALLERHVLNGLVDAQWVRTDDPESDDDDGFFAALQELVAYAFEESVRIKKKGRVFPGWHEIPVRSSRGILQEVQSLLRNYRSELVRQSRLLDQGGRA
jgi:hypothetical protein